MQKNHNDIKNVKTWLILLFPDFIGMDVWIIIIARLTTTVT